MLVDYSIKFYYDFTIFRILWDFSGGPVVILHAPNAGVQGSIPGQGTRSHMLQLKIMHTTTKIPRALPKTQCSQIKNKKNGAKC